MHFYERIATLCLLQMFMSLAPQHILRRLSINRISFVHLCLVSLSLSAPNLAVIFEWVGMGRTTFEGHKVRPCMWKTSYLLEVLLFFRIFS